MVESSWSIHLSIHESIHLSIHASIHSISCYLCSFLIRVTRLLDYPSLQWARGRIHPGQVTWHTASTYPHNLDNLKSQINPKVDVFRLWEKTGIAGENPHKHEENMQSPQRKVQLGLSLKTWFSKHLMLEKRYSCFLLWIFVTVCSNCLIWLCNEVWFLTLQIGKFQINSLNSWFTHNT